MNIFFLKDRFLKNHEKLVFLSNINIIDSNDFISIEEYICVSSHDLTTCWERYSLSPYTLRTERIRSLKRIG